MLGIASTVEPDELQDLRQGDGTKAKARNKDSDLFLLFKDMQGRQQQIQTMTSNR